MEFRLPEQLKKELVNSVVLKTEFKKTANNTAAPRAKNRYPFGDVPGLVPEYIMNGDQYQGVIENINQSDSCHRNYFRPLTDTSPAILIYHYDHCWVSGWIPVQSSNPDYLYGYTIAYKNTPSAKQHVSDIYQYLFETAPDECKKVIKVKRTEFNVLTRYITVEDIKNSTFNMSKDYSDWVQPGFYSTFSKENQLYHRHRHSSTFSIECRKIIGFDSPSLGALCNKRSHYVRAVARFYECFSDLIPCFSEDSHVFCRLATKNILSYFFFDDYNEMESGVSKNILLDPGDFNFNLLKKMSIEYVQSKPDGGCQFLKCFNNVLSIIDTPFFRKKINEKCTEAVDLFNTADQGLTAKQFETIKRNIYAITKSINFIHFLFPNCPLDYYQVHYDKIMRLNNWMCSGVLSPGNQSSYNWIRENLPVSSFFNMLNKESEDNSLHVNRELMSDFQDIVSMLSIILAAGLTVDVPKRWRLSEFHDSVQSIAWKIENKNVVLPQYLFPDPIKIEHDEKTWTFFQPKNTHQLASWGKAVRNCVGSSHYGDQVKKRKAFIVLCMIDEKPLFTVQLTMSDSYCSSLTVQQIKGLCNAALTVEEETLYSKVFQQALELRSEQAA